MRTKNLSRFAVLCTLATLAACSPTGLQKDDRGWVSYASAQPEPGRVAPVPGRFVRERGCILFVLENGRRFIPIMPEGRSFSVEPERALFDSPWVVRGLDAASPAVQALADDPVAKACGARPAFIIDIAPPPPPDPPPAAAPTQP